MERNTQYSDEPDQSLFFVFFFPFIDNYFAGGGAGGETISAKKSVIPESLRNHAEFNPFLSSV